MYFSERLKRDVYIATADTSTTPTTYVIEKAPHRMNCLPTTAGAESERFGISFSQGLTAVCDKAYAADIHEMDLAYIGTAPKDFDDKLASDAEFIVSGKVDGVDGSVITFSRRAGTKNGQ